MTGTTRTSKDPDQPPVMEGLTRMLAHPLRVRILRELQDRMASPAMLARDLGQRLNVVAYHVRLLRDADCIELVDQRQRRGATEHFYRAKVLATVYDEQMARLPVSVRNRIYGDAIQTIFTRVAAAANSRGFDRDDAHVSYSPVRVDEQGSRELAALLRSTVEEFRLLEARAVARAAAATEPEPLMDAEVSMFQYLLPSPP